MFGVWNEKFKVEGSGLRGLGCRAQDAGCRVFGVGFMLVQCVAYFLFQAPDSKRESVATGPVGALAKSASATQDKRSERKGISSQVKI